MRWRFTKSEVETTPHYYLDVDFSQARLGCKKCPHFVIVIANR